jgi:chemotaxis protein CheD
MKPMKLDINQTDVTEEAVLYTCYGLGSCIALFLNDRMTGLAGGAHIPISGDTFGDLRSAKELLEELLSKFRVRGSQLKCLRAKLAGGAQLFDGSIEIGKDNVSAVHRELLSRGIYLAGADLGGTIPRTARFNTRTGELVVSTGEHTRMII